MTVSDTLAGSTDDIKRLLEGGNLTSDEAVRLLREHNTGVNKFLREFAVVNEIQAQHGDDLKQLLRFLPVGLNGVVKTFESETGMVRFSLVTDPENPGCSYGRNRKPPSDRSERFPPKNLRCEGATSASSEDTSGPQTISTGSALDGLDGLEGLPATESGPSLPARMSEWSWTLFYLNAI